MLFNENMQIYIKTIFKRAMNYFEKSQTCTLYN